LRKALAPLAKSGGGDDHNGMEIRLQRLEEDMREVSFMITLTGAVFAIVRYGVPHP
jgi:hypothetical protein